MNYQTFFCRPCGRIWKCIINDGLAICMYCNYEMETLVPPTGRWYALGKPVAFPTLGELVDIHPDPIRMEVDTPIIVDKSPQS